MRYAPSFYYSKTRMINYSLFYGIFILLKPIPNESRASRIGNVSVKELSSYSTTSKKNLYRLSIRSHKDFRERKLQNGPSSKFENKVNDAGISRGPSFPGKVSALTKILFQKQRVLTRSCNPSNLLHFCSYLNHDTFCYPHQNCVRECVDLPGLQWLV